jgi:hypothetical protein
MKNTLPLTRASEHLSLCKANVMVDLLTATAKTHSTAHNTHHVTPCSCQHRTDTERAVMLTHTATLRPAGESQVSLYHPHKMAARSAGKGTENTSLKFCFMTHEVVDLYKQGKWGARNLTPPYLKSATPLKQVLQQEFMFSFGVLLW